LVNFRLIEIVNLSIRSALKTYLPGLWLATCIELILHDFSHYQTVGGVGLYMYIHTLKVKHVNFNMFRSTS